MFKSAGSEFKAIFKNKKLLIPIIAVLLIPVMYSGMFLWAFWDPYEQLSDLPVAIVNNDEGADFEGQSLEIGSELVKKLKDSDQFDFHFVNEKDGYKNLEKQKYYMLVEIPKDFSKNGTTLLEEHPTKLALKYVPNESFNFLSAQIGETAMKEIKASLSKSVSETYAETMFDKIGELGHGFKTASDSASDINKGAGDLAKGAGSLKDNLTTLAEKNVEMNNGVEKTRSGAKSLADGSSELSGGMGQLSENYGKLYNGSEDIQAGIDSLSSGLSQSGEGLAQVDQGLQSAIDNTGKLQSGAQELTGKIGELQEGAGKVNTGAEQVNAGSKQLKEQLTPLLATLPAEQRAALEGALNQLTEGTASLQQGTGALQEGAGALKTGAGTLASGLGALNEGQGSLLSGVNQLESGSAALQEGAGKLQAGQGEIMSNFALLNGKLNEAKDGTQRLAAGAGELSAGMDLLYDGSSRLTEGSRQLADGSAKLADGSTKLSEGTGEYGEKLKEASEKANSVKPNEETADMMAAPVDVKNEKINHVPNYGTGFTPYFLSLGLFVGALLISIVYPLREPAGIPSNGGSWFFGKLMVLATVGIIQSIVAVAILLWGLGLEVESVPLFLLFSVVTSFTFLALIQMLVTILGDPGRFVAIVILILQLTTSAGTFPLELIPTALQPISALLPMTYSVAGFKAVISSGDMTVMWNNLGILCGYAAVFAVITLTFFIVKFKKQADQPAEA